MYALFDIGGTHLRVGRVNENNEIEYESVPTPQDYAEGIEQMAQLVAKLAQKGKIEKMVGGSAGILDPERKTILKASNLHGWEGKKFVEDLQNKIGVPVILANDAALGALGEATYGAGKDYKIVAYLTIGTGVGGARVVDGKMDTTVFGTEPGHHILDVDKSVVPDAEYGALEDYVSGMAIKKRYGKKAEEITDPAIWQEISKLTAVGIHNMTVFWSPEVVVIGGGRITTPNLIPMLETELKKVSTLLPRYPDLKLSLLGDAVTLWGAQALASQK
jgi:glucokinase